MSFAKTTAFWLLISISEYYPGMVVMLALSSFSVSRAEVSREAVLWRSGRAGQPSHSAALTVPAHLLRERVSALPSCVRHRNPSLPGAAACVQVSGDAARSPGGALQVPWWESWCFAFRELKVIQWIILFTLPVKSFWTVSILNSILIQNIAK